MKLSRATLEMAAGVERTLNEFTAKHPDWKLLEPKMIKMSIVTPPRPGQSELDYLETLYQRAQRPTPAES